MNRSVVLSSGTALAADTFKKMSLAVVPLVVLAAGPARGAEVTRIVSALDDDNRFDFHLTASWFHEVRSSLVKRELQSSFESHTDVVKDLKFAQTRDILNLRADVGVLWNVGLHIDLPLVLSDLSRLNFDQDGSPCLYPESPEIMADPTMRPNCVDSHNATILRDGILPGYRTDSWGLDAQTGMQYARGPGVVPGPPDVFRGPARKGFENLGVGITWAPFNQARDDTKPTWTLSFDAKLDIFKDKRFDRATPNANTAVGPGYHQFVWSTFVSKRFRHFDPYFGAWYMLPARTNGSPFQKYGPTQTSVNPQQQAGIMIGVEQIAWENPRGDQRVTIEARAHVQQHFFGRERSAIWEGLAGDSRCNVNTSSDPSLCRPGIDLDTNADGVIDTPHPGITDIESYGTVGGDLGLNIQVGRFIRFRSLFGFRSDLPHYITAAGSGVDVDGDNRVKPTRTDPNEAQEANPIYRQAIDLPGRRFRVEGSQIWTLMVQGSMMF
jgi:hypothetical protein